MGPQRMAGLLMVTLESVEGLKYLMFGGKGGSGRKVVSKVTFNNCRCNGTDMCGGGADPMLDVYIDNDRGERITAFCSNRLEDNVSKRAATKIGATFPALIDTDINVVGKDKNRLLLIVKDHDKGSIDNDEIGYAHIDLIEIFRAKGQKIKNHWVKLLKDPDNPKNSPGDIMISIEFFDYMKRHRDMDMSVPCNHFPVTTGNDLRLYHDASRMDPKGQGWDTSFCHFDDGAAWTDLYEDILGAKHFIVIMGWSVNLAIPLKRSWVDAESHEETLGIVLARKQKETDCEVYIVVWDDPSSIRADGLLGGMMGTSDEATRVFCEEHNINFDKHKRISYYEGYTVMSSILDMHFTHHQKMVVFDKPAASGSHEKRVLKAYFGGLDLTNGRYDTPEHHLFDYNETVFSPNTKVRSFNDFYNNCVRKGGDPSLGGPRQPWHDIHASVEGPLAWDFLVNFIERTNTQSNTQATYDSPAGEKVTLYKKFKSSLDRLMEEDKVITPHYKHLKGKRGLFDTQMFRSICYKSAYHSRSPFEKYGGYRYHFASDQVIDHSIQNAYIYQITRAKRFIYFENQYWVGSSFAWFDCKKAPSHHRVPDSVVRTICRHIDSHNDFHVYINIPLFPEGVPSDLAIQEILHLQYQTIRMMVKRVAEHLESVGRAPEEWRDFLSVYFMGKREPPGTTSDNFLDMNDPSSALQNSPTASSRRSNRSSSRTSRAVEDVIEKVKTFRRHPIYIHSKFFVVDDEYALLGSANVNERSMCGIRDTEIAAGIWQPEHTTKGSAHSLKLPKGYVSEMRKHLWIELMGDSNKAMDDPGSKECIKLVRQRAESNRAAYWNDAMIDMLPHGFMCEYPYKWDTKNKDLEAFGEDGMFPDFNASIIGKASAITRTMAVTG